MNKKLYWICIAFLTNPMIWLLGGLSIATQGYLTYSLIRNPGIPVLAPSISLREYGPEFYYGARFQRNAQGNVERIPTVGIPPETVVVRLAEGVNPADPTHGQQIWDDLKKLPDLKALRCDGVFNGDLSPLVELPHLESLRLEQSLSRGNEPRKLPSLKPLTHLSELEISSFPVEQIVDAVRENENLTTLIYRGDLNRTASSDDLQTLAKLKQLRVLAVGPFLNWESPERIRQSLAAFDQNPSLKLLCVGGFQNPRSEKLRTIQSLVPHAVVVPMAGEQSTNHIVFLGGFLFVMSGGWWLAAAVAFGETNFRYLGSMVLPRYARPHLFFMGILITSWMAFNTVLLVRNGMPLLSCLSLFLTSMGVFALISFRATGPNPTPMTRRMRIASLLLMFSLIFLMNWASMNRGNIASLLERIGIGDVLWIEWIRFLYGFHPGIAAGGILFGIISIAFALSRAPTNYRRLMELGHVDPSPVGYQKMNPAFDIIGPQRTGDLPWLWKPLGTAIERLPDREPQTRREQALFLYSRISGVPRRFWLLTAIVPPLGAVPLTQFVAGTGPDSNPAVVIAIGLLGGMAMYCPVFLIGHWASKGVRLGQEILIRPIERNKIRSLISRAIWRDIAVYVVGIAAIIGGICWKVSRVKGLPDWDSLSMLGVGSSVAFLILLFAAYAHFVVTIRQSWLGKVQLFGSGIAFVFIIMGTSYWQALLTDRRINIVAAFGVFSVLILLASWLYSKAYGRLLTADFG